MPVADPSPATLPSKPGGRFRWGVLALLFVIYMLASADRANIGIVLPYVQQHFRLTNTQAGVLVSLFFVAYGFGQIPAAFVIKRFGVRAVMPLAMALTSLMTALHGIVSSVFLLKGARIGLGLAEAPIANGAITTINNWFPAREKGIAVGIFMASSKAGPVIVPPLGALIILHYGWHWVFVLFALPGFVLPFLWYRLVRNDPADSPRVTADEVAWIRQPLVSAEPGTGALAARWTVLDRLIRARPVRPITSSAAAFRNWNVWGAAFSYFVLVGSMNVILAWVPKYLLEVRRLSILDTGFMSAAPFIGAVVGNLIGGWISDRLLDKRRKPLMMLSCLSTGVTMYVFAVSSVSPAFLAPALFVMGFLLSLGFSLFAIYSAGLARADNFSVTTSINNTLGQLGGAALPLLAGVILDHGSWPAVFAMLSGASIVAFLLLASIIEPRGFIAEMSVSTGAG